MSAQAAVICSDSAVGSVLDAVHDESVRCVVVDLGSLPTREEQSLVAAVVLGDLWRRRAERRPVLIVIDEAHNVCPAELPDLLVALATDHAIRIAAEGRKFGLYLLVSTQRPQKIPENVLSQADNLVLLRLNSLAAASARGSARRAAPTCRPPGHPRGNDQTYSRRRIQVRVRKPQTGGR
jgi:DNA helicase HerA-like ATPase